MNPNERKTKIDATQETGQPKPLTPELLSAKLLGSLGAKLADYENAETAIAVYRQANVTIKELERVKQMCLDLAHSDMKASGEAHLNTPFGSAGWTAPKTPKLDKTTWENAVRQNAELARFQAEFNRARKQLEAAQEAFMKLPEPAFFIR